MLEIILCSLAAFVAGFVDAIAGGGGVITFPTLMMLGIPVGTIVGTSKLVSAAGTSVAAITFIRGKKVSHEVVRKALPYTCIGAALGAITVLSVPNEFLKPLATTGILLLAIYLFFRPALGKTGSYTGMSKQQTVLLSCGACILGFYDGFFGPGTGMFITFMLIKLLKLDFVEASGTTRVLNLASNLVPLTYFIYQGTIRIDLAVPMMVANIAGGYIGARSALTHGAGFVRWIYLAMAGALIIRMLW
jgi:uncharacterized membrane protein YfcA